MERSGEDEDGEIRRDGEMKMKEPKSISKKTKT